MYMLPEIYKLVNKISMVGLTFFGHIKTSLLTCEYLLLNIDLKIFCKSRTKFLFEQFILICFHPTEYVLSNFLTLNKEIKVMCNHETRSEFQNENFSPR